MCGVFSNKVLLLVMVKSSEQELKPVLFGMTSSCNNPCLLREHCLHMCYISAQTPSFKMLSWLRNSRGFTRLHCTSLMFVTLPLPSPFSRLLLSSPLKTLAPNIPFPLVLLFYICSSNPFYYHIFIWL